mmetsp:Transcript_14461/g.21979  ORF Transcript_14461/g.21979 Transcript_14461/m.21979 type:complete len:292 (+) Transcript_14461:284-1159(+)
MIERSRKLEKYLETLSRSGDRIVKNPREKKGSRESKIKREKERRKRYIERKKSPNGRRKIGSPKNEVKFRKKTRSPHRQAKKRGDIQVKTKTNKGVPAISLKLRVEPPQPVHVWDPDSKEGLTVESALGVDRFPDSRATKPVIVGIPHISIAPSSQSLEKISRIKRELVGRNGKIGKKKISLGRIRRVSATSNVSMSAAAEERVPITRGTIIPSTSARVKKVSIPPKDDLDAMESMSSTTASSGQGAIAVKGVVNSQKSPIRSKGGHQYVLQDAKWMNESAETNAFREMTI